MKKLVLISFCSILFSNIINAQIDSLENASDIVNKEPIFSKVEVMPEFPGGISEMFDYVLKNIKYPKTESKNNIEGISYVSFIIEKDGSVSSVSIVDELRHKASLAMHEEAIRVVKSMPKWIPGSHKGRDVRVKFTLPIAFKLKD